MNNRIAFCDACLRPIANRWIDDDYIDGSRRFHWGECKRIFDRMVDEARKASAEEVAA